MEHDFDILSLDWLNSLKKHSSSFKAHSYRNIPDPDQRWPYCRGEILQLYYVFVVNKCNTVQIKYLIFSFQLLLQWNLFLPMDKWLLWRVSPLHFNVTWSEEALSLKSNGGGRYVQENIFKLNICSAISTLIR